MQLWIGVTMWTYNIDARKSIHHRLATAPGGNEQEGREREGILQSLYDERRSKSTEGKGIYSSEHEHRYRMVCGYRAMTPKKGMGTRIKRAKGNCDPKHWLYKVS